MKITAAVCDDQVYYLEKIKTLAEENLKEANCSEVEIKCFDSGRALCLDEDFLAACQVVFLDINMQDSDGIEIAYHIRKKYPKTYIVFVTAFVDYALMGYRVEAFRYLLKDDLEAMMHECIPELIKKIKREKFSIRCEFPDGEQMVKVSDILFIESFRHKMVFHLTGSSENIQEANGRLGDLENMLREYCFYRVHKSYLVNMNYVQAVERYQVRLVNGEYIKIPRAKYQFVREAYFDTMRAEI